jgi:ribosomal protein L37AE/L43A
MNENYDPAREETEHLTCPRCYATLHREPLTLITLWKCDNCESEWTPDQLAQHQPRDWPEPVERPDSTFL